MIADIWTVLRKDWIELTLAGGGPRAGAVRAALVVFVFGIIIPLQAGRDWVDAPAFLAFWTSMPLLLVSGVVADSFAGERERHTLETLLATPLSDRAILLGKVGAVVAYGWGLAVSSLPIALLTVNLAERGGPLILYPLPVLGGILMAGLLTALLGATAGVLVSLRAHTVRQAQQLLGIAMLALLFLPLLGARLLPAAVADLIASRLAATDPARLAGLALAALAALDLLLLALAAARFRRNRLILD